MSLVMSMPVSMGDPVLKSITTVPYRATLVTAHVLVTEDTADSVSVLETNFRSCFRADSRSSSCIQLKQCHNFTVSSSDGTGISSATDGATVPARASQEGLLIQFRMTPIADKHERVGKPHTLF